MWKSAAAEHHSLDSLFHVAAGVSRESVVQTANEVVTIIIRETHERSTHHDELHLVHAVTQLLQLQQQPPSDTYFTVPVATATTIIHRLSLLQQHPPSDTDITVPIRHRLDCPCCNSNHHQTQTWLSLLQQHPPSDTDLTVPAATAPTIRHRLDCPCCNSNQHQTQTWLSLLQQQPASDTDLTVPAATVTYHNITIQPKIPSPWPNKGDADLEETKMPAYLFYSMTCLQVGVVPGTNRSHGRWLKQSSHKWWNTFWRQHRQHPCLWTVDTINILWKTMILVPMKEACMHTRAVLREHLSCTSLKLTKKQSKQVTSVTNVLIRLVNEMHYARHANDQSIVFHEHHTEVLGASMLSKANRTCSKSALNGFCTCAKYFAIFSFFLF